LFGAQGYTGTTMRDIAAAVGVLPGSLYAHIDGKETLLLEIVEAGIDKFLALGYAAVAGPGSAEDRLRQLIKGHVAIVAQNAERTLVVFHQWRYLTGENLSRVVEKRRQYEAIMTTVVEDGRREGIFNPKLDLKTSVLGLLGALNWTAEWYKPDGPDSGEEIGERLADAVLLGLKDR
jgi:AcrR family transcriptional regulator